jgi:AcrR family transcriptional regulator
MDALNRKQRQFQQREQLILDAAQQILDDEGFASLTMERVAAEVEYSKGTIYNHFTSKEDIISSISCRCMLTLGEMFRRAAAYPGSNRERISAVTIAHSLYAQLHPVDMQNMQIIKSQAIREKISSSKQAEILALEQQVTGIVMDIVHDAISVGDIPPQQTGAVDGIVFGLWTMGYGSNLLHLSGIPFDKLGMRQPLDVAWTNSNKLLDSYQWQPLSSTMDIRALRQKLTEQLFSEELHRLQQ